MPVHHSQQMLLPSMSSALHACAANQLVCRAMPSPFGESLSLMQRMHLAEFPASLELHRLMNTMQRKNAKRWPLLVNLPKQKVYRPPQMRDCHISKSTKPAKCEMPKEA